MKKSIKRKRVVLVGIALAVISLMSLSYITASSNKPSGLAKALERFGQATGVLQPTFLFNIASKLWSKLVFADTDTFSHPDNFTRGLDRFQSSGDNYSVYRALGAHMMEIYMMEQFTTQIESALFVTENLLLVAGSLVKGSYDSSSSASFLKTASITTADNVTFAIKVDLAKVDTANSPADVQGWATHRMAISVDKTAANLTIEDKALVAYYKGSGDSTDGGGAETSTMFIAGNINPSQMFEGGGSHTSGLGYATFPSLTFAALSNQVIDGNYADTVIVVFKISVPGQESNYIGGVQGVTPTIGPQITGCTGLFKKSKVTATGATVVALTVNAGVAGGMNFTIQASGTTDSTGKWIGESLKISQSTISSFSSSSYSYLMNKEVNPTTGVLINASLPTAQTPNVTMEVPLAHFDSNNLQGGAGHEAVFTSAGAVNFSEYDPSHPGASASAANANSY